MVPKYISTHQLLQPYYHQRNKCDVVSPYLHNIYSLDRQAIMLKIDSDVMSVYCILFLKTGIVYTKLRFIKILSGEAFLQGCGFKSRPGIFNFFIVFQFLILFSMKN